MKILIIQIDIDPTEINRVMKPDVGIIADASQATQEIINILPKHNEQRPSREEEFQNIKTRKLQS